MSSEKLPQKVKTKIDRLVESEDTFLFDGREVAFMDYRVNVDEVIFNGIDKTTSHKFKHPVLFVHIDLFLSRLKNTANLPEPKDPPKFVAIKKNSIPMSQQNYSQDVKDISLIEYPVPTQDYNMDSLKQIIVDNIKGLKEGTMQAETAREISSQVDSLIKIVKTEISIRKVLNNK
jgi:hypothetical protein